MLRRMIRGLIIFLVGAGLVALVYIMRPDVPVDSAISRVPTFVADTVGPISADSANAKIGLEGAKRIDADQLRAELAHKPQSVGWGDSYAVRLLNSAGQPMQVFGVLLVAHMADGSVEETAMGTLAEPGVRTWVSRVYRGTVPTGRSMPVDLRVRVRFRVGAGDKFVEIPVTR